MEDLVDSMIAFVRVRQLNIVLAGLITLVYVVYQYWDVLCKGSDMELCCRHSSRRMSRTRSRSPSNARNGRYEHDTDEKYRRKKRRCHDCSLCNYE